MAEYCVTVEIELQADNPKHAAQLFLDWLNIPPGVYLAIQNLDTGIKDEIDTEEWLKERE